ncbi:hypothetical protein BDV06DRAFT_219021 [Aspergillus oleicola]
MSENGARHWIEKNMPPNVDDEQKRQLRQESPWSSALDVLKAIVRREVACVEKFPTFPRNTQQGIYGGPGGYRPAKEAKLSVLQDFNQLCPYIMPKNEKASDAVLWHSDLHAENIFVDAENPTQITSVIDWQSAPVYPMFLHAHQASLIDFEGPKLNGFEEPALPENLSSLDPEAQKAAKHLFVSQTLWLSYELSIRKAVPELLYAFRQRDTLLGQIQGMIGSTYDDGEPCVQSLLADLNEENVWKQIVGADEDGTPSVPCPVQYSDDERARQRAEYEKWSRDVERKTRVIDEIGVYTGWNGAVPPKDYEEVARRLAIAKDSFLERESTEKTERALWEAVWPFQDHPVDER